MGENTVKYWSSTIGFTEKSGCIIRTNTYYFLKIAENFFLYCGIAFYDEVNDRRAAAPLLQLVELC